MLSNILIIDKRKELSVKYKKCLENEEIIVNISRNLKDSIHCIQKIIPDIIIISDSIDEELSIFCKRIRTLTYDTRPIIIALSKSAETSDKISILESGADDFISEPVNIDEFKMRIRAHLRRDIELNIDYKTLLPNKKYIEKNIKRILNTDEKPAILLLSIENIKNYKSIYTDIAGDKLIQTLIAIIKSVLEKSDFLGQLDENNFVIITNSYSAEKMATFLTFAFDTVVPKFYNNEDVKRGYMLLKNDSKAGMRSNFVNILIGGILNNYESIYTIEGILERLYSIKKTAKMPVGSGYMLDRIKLTGSNSVFDPVPNKTIFIKEADDALSILLRTSLELQGYDVIVNLDMNAPQQPLILIIDGGEDLINLDLCKKIKSNKNFVNTKIIVTTTIHDKNKVLNAGADLYLPKPYDILDLIQWIKYFIK